MLAGLGALSLLAAGCTSSGGGSGSSTSGGKSGSAASTSVLGTPHKATGSPIKIGYVNDGQGEQTDNSGQWEMAKAAASYANDYLNGINGHVIQLDHCETKYTASGGTSCGVQMVTDKVAAAIVPTSAEDKYVFATTQKAKIPFIALSSADGGVTGAPYGFVLTNGLTALAALLQISEEKGIKKAGIIIIDVPAAAAVGPITKPMFAKAGIEQDFIPIAASAADQTGRLQQAINSGTGAFTVTGTETFVVASLKAFKQLQFKGPIVTSQPVTKTMVAAVPGGVAGVTSVVSQTGDTNDPDVQVAAAAKAKYATNVTGTSPDTGFISVLSFVRALQGQPSAVDAKSINTALNTMPKPVKLAIGGGITFQCGTHPVAITPNVCTTQYLKAALDKDGNATSYVLGDAKPLFAT